MPHRSFITGGSLPRMARHGYSRCRICEMTIEDGSGCMGPVLEADSPDYAKTEELKAEGKLRRDQPLPRWRRRVTRAVRPYGDIQHPPEHCPDCGASLGQYHHWGCGLEQCPTCEEQLYFCGCTMEATDAIGLAQRV